MLKFWTDLNLAKFNLILEEKNNLSIWSGSGGQNGQKWAKNSHKMAKNVQTIKCIFFGLDYDKETPKKHLTPYLSVVLITWAPVVPIFAL